MFEKIKSFIWNENLGIIWLFVTLLLLIFVIYPLSSIGYISETLSDVIVSFLLILSLISINVFREKKKAIFIFWVIVFTLNFLNMIVVNPILNEIHVAGKIIFFNIVIFIVFKTILKNDKVTKYTVIGSIVVYLLFGLMCSIAYNFCYNKIPGSFHLSDPIGNAMSVSLQFLYYSFTTLTTLGMGDITPVSPIARSITIFEALIGQLYPVVMIGSVISMRVERKTSEFRSKEKMYIKEKQFPDKK